MLLQPKGFFIPSDPFEFEKMNKIQRKGAQSAWNTVFFYQYLVPLIIYLMFYFTIWPVSLIDDFESQENVPFTHEYASHFAMIAHTIHYGRRLIEVAFVHRFSSATLAVRHIPKYCFFYGYVQFL